MKPEVKLISNWDEVLRRSYVVWASLLGSLSALAEVNHAELVAIMPFLETYVEKGTFATVSFFVYVAIPILRVVKQASLQNGQPR